ncbi:unnamed protein product [Urochloa humidicola]
MVLLQAPSSLSELEEKAENGEELSSSNQRSFSFMISSILLFSTICFQASCHGGREEIGFGRAAYESAVHVEGVLLDAGDALGEPPLLVVGAAADAAAIRAAW